MRNLRPRTTTALAILLTFLPGILFGQQSHRPLSLRPLIPELLAGPREPVTSATLLGVVRNPNEHGRGIEAEVSIGTTLPILLLSGSPEGSPVVVGLEAAAFARFALQVIQREMVATDWFFAIPVIWHRADGWFRFRFYHTSSHMGDEYARRFEDPGVNFSRDAAEIFYFRSLSDRFGVYGGVKYAYNTHPEESRWWAFRVGGQMEGPEENVRVRPFLAADLEMDRYEGRKPRLEMRTGVTLNRVGILQALRLSLTFLTGPSPLGQFTGKSTTQVGLTIQKTF